eukprot:g4550.t1
MRLTTKADQRRIGSHKIDKAYERYLEDALAAFEKYAPALDSGGGGEDDSKGEDRAGVYPASHVASVMPHGPWCYGQAAHEVIHDEIRDGKVIKVGSPCNVRCAGCRAVRRLAYRHFIYESGEVLFTADENDFITFEDLSQIYTSYYFRAKRAFRERKNNESEIAGKLTAKLRGSKGKVQPVEAGSAAGGEGNVAIGTGSEATRHDSMLVPDSDQALSPMEVVENPQLWAIDVAKDSNIGMARMARRDVYVLVGLESLTVAELEMQISR